MPHLCRTHCPGEGGGGFLAALAVLAAVAAVAAVAWLTANWVLVLAAVIVTAAVGAVGARVLSKVSRRLSRLAVVSWPSRAYLEDPAALRARLALPARPSLRTVAAARTPAAIRQARPQVPVVHAVITDVKVRARG